MTEESEDDSNSSDDNLLNWQNVTTKRKKIIKTTNTQKKQKNTEDLTEEPSCSNNNRFAKLAEVNEEDLNDDNDDNEEVAEADEVAETNLKPPPIFINNVTNINQMVKCVSSVIASSDFNYKGLNDGQVKLNLKTVDSYRTLTKYFNTNNLSYHTYQLKSERAFRFVIKGLHHSTKESDIKADLISKGHLVRYITNVKSKFTKNPLPMFYVDIDPSPNNKQVYDIKKINHCIVQIEAPRSTDDIVQCHRCQQFGHTKTYCRKPFVCVKCGLGHATPECQKLIETPPRCVNCLKHHTASYRGCEVYQTLLRKRLAERRPFVQNQFSMNNNDFPHLNKNFNHNHSSKNTGFNNNNTGETYASALNVNNNVMKNIETLLHKQIELTNTLMNMMSLLINKLCK